MERGGHWMEGGGEKWGMDTEEEGRGGGGGGGSSAEESS